MYDENETFNFTEGVSATLPLPSDTSVIQYFAIYQLYPEPESVSATLLPLDPVLITPNFSFGCMKDIII